MWTLGNKGKEANNDAAFPKWTAPPSNPTEEGFFLQKYWAKEGLRSDRIREAPFGNPSSKSGPGQWVPGAAKIVGERETEPRALLMKQDTTVHDVVLLNEVKAEDDPAAQTHLP